MQKWSNLKFLNKNFRINARYRFAFWEKISNIQRTIRYSSQPLNVGLKQLIFLGLNNDTHIKRKLLKRP